MENKKIVIRINRSQDREKARSSRSESRQITQWNIKRIVLALVILLSCIVIPFCYLDKGLENAADDKAGIVEHKPEKEKPVTEKQQPESLIEKKLPEKALIESVAEKPSGITTDDINKPVLDNTEKPADSHPQKIPEAKVERVVTHHKVPRALLARGVSNNEPFGKITRAVTVNSDKATGIFYFTEIKNFKGATFYHQWLHDDRLVYKRPIKVLGNRWRASTSKLFNNANTGQWTVRLADKAGRVYNRLDFKVIAE
ncbi:MAG: hypothetical protein CVV13_06180 [Gammaproteobacteria bacterium HGW-Gammaproteobacteria-3]|nr:MAG: hypothetical protein CVV13_06180 [Gammaproteobacteria bacterium HGW-Gammaproteobacteria-3]